MLNNSPIRIVGAILLGGLSVLLTACHSLPPTPGSTGGETAAVHGATAGLTADKPAPTSGQPEGNRSDSSEAQANSGGAFSDAATSKPAPNISLPLNIPKDSGAARHLADYKGKVVVLDFWATWCGPCKESIPELEKIYSKYHTQGLEVFGISVDQSDSEHDIPGVVKELGITYPIVLASGIPDVNAKYSFDSIPSVYIIDKAGRIRGNLVGYDKNSGEDKEIEALLKE